MKVFLAYPSNERRVDGLRDYSTYVVEQLREEGTEAVLLRPPLGRRLVAELVTALPQQEDTALLVQYQPFSWGRWGVAPALILAVGLVRLLRPNVRIMLVIHEAYVPMRDLKWLLMGLWQRTQLRLLFGLAHRAIATTTGLTDELSRLWPRCPVSHVAVGSNLPDERRSRGAVRAEAGYEGRLVIATFSSGHESHLHNLVAPAVQAVARSSPEPVVLLLLGSANVPTAEFPDVERSVIPGYLPGQALAQALSAADLFLGPYVDGASTRRGTLMAAMQHAVAIVTTVSDRTDPILTEGALALASPTDGDAFAAEAVRVGVDRHARERHAAAGRALFDRYFSWSAVCAGLRETIAEAFAPSPERPRVSQARAVSQTMAAKCFAMISRVK